MNRVVSAASLGLTIFLGRYPRLRKDAASLALNTYKTVGYCRWGKGPLIYKIAEQFSVSQSQIALSDLCQAGTRFLQKGE
jgi:hypothetical protein